MERPYFLLQKATAMIMPTCQERRSATCRLADHPRNQKTSEDAGPVATETPKGNFIYETDFEDEALGQSMSLPVSAGDAVLPKPPARLPAYLAHLWTVPLLSPAAERHWFRKYNYLKYRLWKLEQAPSKPVRSSQAQAVSHKKKELEEEISAARRLLIESNLRLVIALAKRYAPNSTSDFEEHVSVGNEALLRSIERFDYRYGFRFSSYAYQAIKCAMFAWMRTEKKKRELFAPIGQELTDTLPCQRAMPTGSELDERERAVSAQRLLGRLDPQDRAIVLARFGFTGDAEGPVAFRTISKQVGLSTTRVVQRFHRAMARLREMQLAAGV